MTVVLSVTAIQVFVGVVAIQRRMNSMKGVQHYFKNGKKYNGGTHKMPNGSTHSGKTHNKNSKPVVHLKDLSKTTQARIKKGK